MDYFGRILSPLLGPVSGVPKLGLSAGSCFNHQRRQQRALPQGNDDKTTGMESFYSTIDSLRQ